VLGPPTITTQNATTVISSDVIWFIWRRINAYLGRRGWPIWHPLWCWHQGRSRGKCLLLAMPGSELLGIKECMSLGFTVGTLQGAEHCRILKDGGRQ